MRDVDVIVPVYDGYEETRKCLQSVRQTIDPSWARLVIINDDSPNIELTQFLAQFAREHADVVLLENAENLGFVSTANRGLEFDAKRDVLLLNSDVEVFGDWLTRMREAAYRSDRVGSVTPFSNNATLFSFPNVCKVNELVYGLDGAEIDAVFARLFSADDVIDMPTGVGFCMFMRRDCLEQVGLFDVDTFGRGYGEENDWCQRAIAASWRNVHLTNCFVYHKGGVSFASEQSPRIDRAIELLDKRYPEYHRTIQDYIADDHARSHRTLALLDLFAQQSCPKMLMLCHKLGGGVQHHIDELAQLHAGRALFAQITPEIEGQSVRLAFHDGRDWLQDGLYFDVEREYDKLLQVLQAMGVTGVHYHHTMGLHPRLWLLARDLGCASDFTVHDYYLVNGNPTLTDNNARFVGEPPGETFDQQCAEHYPLPAGVNAQQWLENQRPLVEGVDRVIFPSKDAHARFIQFFSLQSAIVAPPPDALLAETPPSPAWSYTGGRPLKVLAVGALSREKGADVLDSVAKLLAEDAIEFHLLGYAYRALTGSIVTHGPYGNEKVARLVKEIAPDVVWFPALWPETYSYTLSVALHAGLPVVVPDIGAFAERVEQRDYSVTQPWNNSSDDWVSFWREVIQSHMLPVSDKLAVKRYSDTPVQRNFYMSAYLAEVPATGATLSKELQSALESNFAVAAPTLSRKEKILALIWRLSRTAVIARLVSWVPFRLQQAIKRRLSSRPLHDIVRNS